MKRIKVMNQLGNQIQCQPMTQEIVDAYESGKKEVTIEGTLVVIKPAIEEEDHTVVNVEVNIQ